MRFRYVVPYGEAWPNGFAPSYRQQYRDAIVAYPIGLHLVIRWCRDAWFWLMYVGYPGYYDRVVAQVYFAGRRKWERDLEVSSASERIRERERIRELVREAYDLGFAAAVRALDERANSSESCPAGSA